MGVQQALLAAGGGDLILVTLGSVGVLSGYGGPSDGNFGSIVPTSYNIGSPALVEIFSEVDGAGVDFQVNFFNLANPGQALFNRIEVQDMSGAIRTYVAASATTYQFSASRARWWWGTGSNPAWLQSPGTVRTARFFP